MSRTLIAQGHVREVVAHRITQAEATVIVARFDGLTADVAYNGTVHLRPRRPFTTAEEVAVLRVVCACTDAPVCWHRAVAG